MYPILFETKFFTLHTIWVFFALGIFAFTYTLIKLGIKNGLKLQFLSSHSWKLIILSIIGARILALIINFQTYFIPFDSSAFLRIFHLWDKGFNLYGGIIAFVLYFYFACKKNEQDFWKWLDILVPSSIIGLAFRSLGAFFEGIYYGNETSLPWGVNFESPWVRYTVPIHPTQIYAFLYALVISFILIYLSQAKKFKEKTTGLIGIGGVAIFSFLRFLEEFLRGDDTIFIFNIRLPQILALLITISTGILFYLRYNRPSPKKSK